MRSAYISDAALCETMNTVGELFIPLIAFLRAASVAKSRADALSSRISTSGFLTIALAIVSLCL